MTPANTQQQNSGFALLLTLVVVSVVVAIGLTLLDITLKQIVISGTGRDSEIAFHAAYAGAECAQYWRLQKLDENHPYFDWCLTDAPYDGADEIDGDTSSPASDVYLTQYRIDWSQGSTDRCTEIDLYIFDASAGTVDVSYNIIAFEEDEDEVCRKGNVCTFMLSRGYNRSCSDLNSLQTVQREVLLEF